MRPSPLIQTEGKTVDDLTFLGSSLFTRRVSGPRVVLCTPPADAPEDSETPAVSADAVEAKPEEAEEAKVEVKGKYEKRIDGVKFQNYGAHAEAYKCCYLTAACAIGATRDELEIFLDRFETAVLDYKGVSASGRKGGGGKREKKEKKQQTAPSAAEQTPPSTAEQTAPST